VLRSVLRGGELVRHGTRVYSRALDEAEADFATSFQGLLDGPLDGPLGRAS
jgi:hypothetical protein